MSSPRHAGGRQPDAAVDLRATTYDPRAFPPFGVTVDIVLLTAVEELAVLLVERGEAPFLGHLALPGGFVRPDESVEDAASRELIEETGITESVRQGTHLEQLGTFGAVDRDPRMRVVSVAHVALLADQPLPEAESDAADARWVSVADALAAPLAFDHREILVAGVERVRSKLEYTTLATELTGTRFTLAELRGVYERVWGASLDPANFRRKVIASEGFIVPTDEQRSPPSGGPLAQVYRPGPRATLHPPLLRP